MNQVLSHNLWSKVRTVAREARQRRAAIAYVTEDLIGFRRGDLLITDASPDSVKAGHTGAKTLRALARRGVRLYSCRDLHAKVLLLGDVAVIGSGNMSASSNSRLVEAALMTEAATVVASVASLIEQLKNQSQKLEPEDLAALAKIKVQRRGFLTGRKNSRRKRVAVSGFKGRTWLVGVYDEEVTTTPAEKTQIARMERAAAKKHDIAEKDIGWILWEGGGPFKRNGREGDLLIQICSPTQRARPNRVLRPVPVLLKKYIGKRCFVFVPDPAGNKSRLPWVNFKQLVKNLGGPANISGSSERLLRRDLADAISLHWKTA